MVLTLTIAECNEPELIKKQDLPDDCGDPLDVVTDLAAGVYLNSSTKTTTHSVMETVYGC